MVKEMIERMERQNSKKVDIVIDQDKAKEMIEKQNSEKLSRKLETKEEIGKDVKDMLKPKENSTLEESLRRKLEVEEEIEQERTKSKEIVNKGRKTNNNEENENAIVQ